jgi:hypothetical protein
MSGARHRKRGHLPPFVPLIRTTLASPAWKQLSFGARCLYVALRSYLRVDNLNNGKVFRSYREAAADLGTKSMSSIHRWFRELEHYGFIVMTTGAHLGVDGDGIAAHWRLTECPTFDARGNQCAATRDFERWDGELFTDPKKQNPALKRGAPRTQKRCTPHSKRGPKRSRCTQNECIDSEASMHSKEVHNCLPLPTAPLCWASPRLVEVLDPAERTAIQAFWKPKILGANFSAASRRRAS